MTKGVTNETPFPFFTKMDEREGSREVYAKSVSFWGLVGITDGVGEAPPDPRGLCLFIFCSVIVLIGVGAPPKYNLN